MKSFRHNRLVIWGNLIIIIYLRQTLSSSTLHLHEEYLFDTQSSVKKAYAAGRKVLLQQINIKKFNYDACCWGCRIIAMKIKLLFNCFFFCCQFKFFSHLNIFSQCTKWTFRSSKVITCSNTRGRLFPRHN